MYGMRLPIPLTLKKYTFLNGNVVFDLHGVFEECKP